MNALSLMEIGLSVALVLFKFNPASSSVAFSSGVAKLSTFPSSSKASEKHKRRGLVMLLPGTRVNMLLLLGLFGAQVMSLVFWGLSKICQALVGVECV